ncbi:MAG TPA: protease modulator HflC, partial [Dehalococcoidia bacterium]|nr:protease modulator HflC [Dehalococcoidia bacterium]
MRVLIVIAVLAIIGLIVLRQTIYIVDQTEQVAITRFGEVQSVRDTPGLNVKMPFVDVITRLDKRVLRIDSQAAALPDRDKQNLIIDLYARYRITDPVAFRKTLQTETEARSRLADIVISALRDRIALRDRFDIIGAKPVLNEQGQVVVDEEGLTIVEGTETRTEILNEVLEIVKQRTESQAFGIEVIDVRLKRADFPESVADSIYTRMRAERNRIATRFRAEGGEEDLKIRAGANRRREVILAEAERQSSRVRGEGEAEAIRILAQALNQDPDFFAFRRSLEAYQKFLSQQDTIILSAEAPLFRFLASPGDALPEVMP